MDKKVKYILMYQDEEVLSFLVTFGERNDIEILEKLDHFDKAPYGVKEKELPRSMNMALYRFFNARSIPPTRKDYEQIIKYTGVKDTFELSFKGHGLSLSNHYWYRKEDEHLKYADINFFTNKWDDSFAKAVLSGNYQDLQNVDLNVPDIVTAGWGVKGWLCEECPKLYKMGIDNAHSDESLAEVLASRLAKRMFKEDESVEYQLKEIYGRYASVSKCIIGVDEELVPLSNVLPHELYNLYRDKNINRDVEAKFFETVSKSTLPGAFQFFTKLSCFRSLCFVNDLHFDNLSAIRNIKTNEVRLAPILDLGGAFGSSANGKKQLSTINLGTYMLIYFAYGNLDPKWDYSWYNPDSLIGFEDDIKELLSKSEFYTPQLIDNIIDVYTHQKNFLDEMWQNQKEGKS